jgi:hypothetical protein
MEGYFQRLENVARLAIVALIKLESAGFGVEGTCGRGVWEKLFRPDLRLGRICGNWASQVPATEVDWESIAKKEKVRKRSILDWEILMDVGLLLFRVRLYSSGQRWFTKRQVNFNKDYRSNDLLKENDAMRFLEL